MKRVLMQLSVVVTALLTAITLAGGTASASKAHHFNLTRHGIRGIHIGEPIAKAARHVHAHVNDHCGRYWEFGFHRYSKHTWTSLVEADSEFSRKHHHIASISLMANSPGHRTPAAYGPHRVRLGATLKAAEKSWGHAFHSRRVDGYNRYWAKGPGRFYTVFVLGRVTNARGHTADHRIWLITMSANRHVALQNLVNQGGC